MSRSWSNSYTRIVSYRRRSPHHDGIRLHRISVLGYIWKCGRVEFGHLIIWNFNQTKSVSFQLCISLALNVAVFWLMYVHIWCQGILSHVCYISTTKNSLGHYARLSLSFSIAFFSCQAQYHCFAIHRTGSENPRFLKNIFIFFFQNLRMRNEINIKLMKWKIL